MNLITITREASLYHYYVSGVLPHHYYAWSKSLESFFNDKTREASL